MVKISFQLRTGVPKVIWAVTLIACLLVVRHIAYPYWFLTLAGEMTRLFAIFTQTAGRSLLVMKITLHTLRKRASIPFLTRTSRRKGPRPLVVIYRAHLLVRLACSLPFITVPQASISNHLICQSPGTSLANS